MKFLLLTLLTTVAFTNLVHAQCISGDCQNGEGTYLLPSGAKYFGDFKNGEIHGVGICKYPDGSKYDGEWENRLYEGYGTKTYADGTTRQGFWKKGLPVDEMGKLAIEESLRETHKNADIDTQTGCLSGNCRNGNGIFAYPDGGTYKGSFANSRPEGWGQYDYFNGDQYLGEFKRGLRDGKGTLKLKNGSQLKGDWIADEYIGNTDAFQSSATGCVQGNCQSGEGIYVYSEGQGKYVGTFLSGFPHGEGTVFYKNGSRYQGQLEKGQLNGYGTLYHTDGRLTEGFWNNGKFTGKRPTQQVFAADANSTTQLGGSKQTKVWAVIVGIANYNHMRVLRYTDDDAYRMYAFLKSPEGGALSDQRIRILIDEDATKMNIKKAMEDVFLRAGSEDLVILYFSGHGLPGSFLPYDYDGYNNKFYHEDINNILQNSPAKLKICIADACHSGSFLNDREMIKDGELKNILESYYNSLATTLPSTALIMSSKSEETSLESNNLRQGVFSHFLIRGLKGEADQNRDDIITIQELFEYVRENVSSYTGNRQSPIIKGNYDYRMPVAMVRGE